MDCFVLSKADFSSSITFIIKVRLLILKPQLVNNQWSFIFVDVYVCGVCSYPCSRVRLRCYLLRYICLTTQREQKWLRLPPGMHVTLASNHST